MKKISLCVSAVLLAVAGFLQAATVNIGNVNNENDSNYIVDVNGVPIAAGTGCIAVGYFSSNVTAGKDLPALVGEFVQYGNSGSFGAFDLDGLFQFVVNGATLGSTGAEGKGMYVLIGNGANIASSNQFVIWNVTQNFAATEPFTLNVNVQDLTPATVENLLVGTTGPSVGGVPSFRMVAVPEPSVAILGGLGALALLRRRRD